MAVPKCLSACNDSILSINRHCRVWLLLVRKLRFIGALLFSGAIILLNVVCMYGMSFAREEQSSASS
jgi:hypothetical protein